MSTTSEALFEQICARHGVRCEAIPTGKTRTADYRFYPSGHEVVAEIKQLEPNREDKAHELAIEENKVAARSYPVGKRMRQEIADSNEQIRALAKDKCPGLLIAYNNILHGPAHTDPMMVLTSMYGQIHARIAVPHDPNVKPYLTDTVFGGNRGVTEGQNTSLSGVCVLYEGDGGAGLNFYHNSFATVRFQPDWLRVAGVRHYGIADAGAHRFEDWIEL